MILAIIMFWRKFRHHKEYEQSFEKANVILNRKAGYLSGSRARILKLSRKDARLVIAYNDPDDGPTNLYMTLPTDYFFLEYPERHLSLPTVTKKPNKRGGGNIMRNVPNWVSFWFWLSLIIVVVSLAFMFVHNETNFFQFLSQVILGFFPHK